KPASEPATPPQQSSGIHVGLSASEPVWIVVKCDGLQVFSGTIGPPEVKQFDAVKNVTTLVGNAGGLRYSMNGKTSDPLGAHGEIQLLEFTAQGPHVLTRRPPQRPSTLHNSRQEQ